MTNTRMLILFVSLFIGRPELFFWAEVTAFNILLIWLLARQERLAASLPADSPMQMARA